MCGHRLIARMMDGMKLVVIRRISVLITRKRRLDARIAQMMAMMMGGRVTDAPVINNQVSQINPYGNPTTTTQSPYGTPATNPNTYNRPATNPDTYGRGKFIIILKKMRINTFIIER